MTRRWRALAGVALILAAGWSGGAAELARADTKHEVRELAHRYPADGFHLKDLDDDFRRLEEFRGRVVLLNFWATWCPPCREEMPSMQRLYRDYKDQGLAIVAVSVDKDSPDEVRSYVEDLGLTFTVLHDRDNRVSDRYRIPGVPASYLVDRQGRIAYKVLGDIDWGRESAVQAVEGLLEEQVQ